MNKLMFWIGIIALAVGLFFGLGGYSKTKRYFIVKTVISNMENEIDGNEDVQKAIGVVKKGGDLGIMLLGIAMPVIENQLIIKLEEEVNENFDSEEEAEIKAEFERIVAKKLDVEVEVLQKAIKPIN